MNRPDQISDECPHFFRKGYYLGSDADYRCMCCGVEASADETAPIDSRGTVPIRTEPPMTN